MMLKETLKQLKALGDAKVRAQNARNGAGDDRLEIVRVIDTPDAMHIRYRVRR